MPPSSQVDSSVNQVATMWIGLSNEAGGVGGLAQTGYATDATPGSNSFDYNLWWEVYDPGSEVGTPMEDYNGSPTVNPGNIIDATVQWDKGAWTFEIYNYNNSQTYTASHSMWWSFWNEQFTPYYNQYIVEAYKTGSTIQQIAQFNPEVNFEGATMYSNGYTQYITDLFNAGDYNTYALEQSSNGANIQDMYCLCPGTYDTSLYGYSSGEWLNSYYSL